MRTLRLFVVALCLVQWCRDFDVVGLQPLPYHELPTRGGIWPKPNFHVANTSYVSLRPQHFAFKVERYDCDIIQEAIHRYYQIIFVNENANANREMEYYGGYNDRNKKSESKYFGYLDVLHIHLMSPCEKYPTEIMDERYELVINTDGFENKALLIAQSVWGLLRGLETFSQIIIPINGSKFGLYIQSVMDFPRYAHRGLLIDTSRHFLPLKIILHIIEAMSYSKLNVLHWHIVDDQSFPFQSNTFPSLSERGAYDPILAVYTYKDIKNVIDYARFRGIRVIPEFDTPGHTLSWGKGLPGILTKCGSPEINGEFGPIDPTQENNYLYLESLFKEIYNLFPDTYIHLGGDEVDFDCWKSNDNIRYFMRKMGIKSYTDLEGYYISRLLNITRNLNAKSVVWQEVFDNNVPIDRDTIVHVWKGSYETTLSDITLRGFQALLSSCWYLDAVSSGGDWRKFYDDCSPFNFPGTPAQKRLVIGGEACMWGEVVDETNVQQRIWPRACSAAEILWSGYPSLDAANRLEEHVCRLKKRNIPAQPPSGPGFCPYFLS